MSVPTPPNPTSHAATRQPVVDGGRLWAGGAATAVVAALVAVVGVLISQGILDIDMVRPVLLFDATDSFVGDYALTSAILALVATGLAHLLLLTTPRPTAFFSWITCRNVFEVPLWSSSTRRMEPCPPFGRASAVM